MHSSKKLFLISALLLCLCACSNRLTYPPENSIHRLQTGASLKQETDKLALPLIESKENIGMVVAIYDGSETEEVYAYGHSDIEKKIAMTTDNLFAIGSVTKSFVVSLLFSLEKEGIMSTEETIGSILGDEISFKDDNVKKITLYQLASHTSGLDREPFDLDSFKSMLHYTYTGDNIYRHITTEYIYQYLSEFTLSKNKPIEAQYSNIGIGLLAHVLTLKTGKDLETLFKEYLFKPLNINNTTTSLSSQQQNNLAIGYSGDQPIFIKRHTPLDNWNFSPVMTGTGALYSTGKDLLQFLKAHLGKSNTSLDSTLNPTRKIIGKNGDDHITPGWYVSILEEYDTTIYYYHGMISGFNCYIGFEPKSEVAVVVLRNSFNWVDKIGHNLILRLSKHQLSRDAKSASISLSPPLLHP